MVLSVGEVAAQLGVCRDTVYRLIQRGELPAARVGSLLRVRRPGLEACEKAVQLQLAATRPREPSFAEGNHEKPHAQRSRRRTWSGTTGALGSADTLKKLVTPPELYVAYGSKLNGMAYGGGPTVAAATRCSPPCRPRADRSPC
jgi:excisionase family DNA binding protein